MNNVFYRFYAFTKEHKAISLILFFLILLISSYFSLNIKLEENIINVIPRDENITKISEVLEGFKMNNRLVFHLYKEDSTATDAQELIDISQELTDSIETRFPQYISEIKLSFPDTQLEKLYGYYTDHLPLYLEPEDYEQLSERTTKAGITQTVEKSYKALISPMSMVTKKMLVKDPFGLVSIPVKKTSKFQVDDNIRLFQNHLLTKDKQHLIFFVGLANPPNETAHNGKFIEGVNGLIEEFRKDQPGLHIEYFGQAAVSVANAARIKQDIIITVSLAVAALFLFISLFYKNISIFFVAITPGVFGAIVAIACLSIVKTSVSVISLGVGSILLGITIDYALHFATHYKDQKDLPALFQDTYHSTVNE